MINNEKQKHLKREIKSLREKLHVLEESMFSFEENIIDIKNKLLKGMVNIVCQKK